ncbi:MAG: DUF952 domain-containing protein [Delftia sp.]|nr:DUF952 domain-containing protein [Delftia sp.]
MTDEPIYHLCRRVAWEAVGRDGLYHGPLGRDGENFLHFSTRAQVEESAARHCAGLRDLMLLEVAVAPLGAALRWESSRGGALFPHLYGPLPLAAVVRSWDLPLGEDGRHVFPRGELA